MTGQDGRSEKQKMLAGDWYRAVGPEIQAEQRRAQTLLQHYNSTLPDEIERREAILKDLLGSIGEGTVIRPPFYCDFGYNIHLGKNVFFNFGCMLLDVASIEIGDFCQIGAMVQILTPDHPRDPEQRRQGYERALPIRIRQNVWIGSGALILPGVTIGEDAIIGAGSVVTRDVPRGATVAGNPASIRK